MRDLTPIYRDAQRFKEERRGANAPDAEALAAIQRGLAEQLAGRNLTPLQIVAAVEETMRGMTWVAAMAELYSLDPSTLLDPPEDIVRNTVAHAQGMGFDARSIELGVGAGYFTGLLVGLKAGPE